MKGEGCRNQARALRLRVQEEGWAACPALFAGTDRSLPWRQGSGHGHVCPLIGLGVVMQANLRGVNSTERCFREAIR